MPPHTILWRRIDQPGHDCASLVHRPDGWELAGSAVFAHDGTPVRLDYIVVCDTRWQTRSARIRGWIGTEPVTVDLAADESRRWYRNGVDCRSADGLLDIDLAFTPATNLLPVRRLDLAVGAAAEVRAAWLSFPSLTVETLDQRYGRTGATTYHYESDNGQFQTELEVNAAGFVIHYPGLWRIEAAA